MTMELKKTHLSRLLGGRETQKGLVPRPHAVDKNSGEAFGGEESQPHTKPPSPGFQCQEDTFQLLPLKISGD